MGNTPTYVWPNIWNLERVRNTKFGRNVCNKMWLNTATTTTTQTKVKATKKQSLSLPLTLSQIIQKW